MSKFFGSNKNITLVNKGISMGQGTESFNECENGDSRIEAGALERILTTNLDAEEECKDATFIKMDIEGAEMDALRGGKNLIKRNKPKLAICIYHSNEDMVQIIKYIHSLVPEYRLFVRNHSGEAIDTVLYAVL